MKDFELFSALTDVDDRYVLEVLEAQTKPVRRRKTQRIIAVAMIVVIIAIAGLVVLQFVIRNRRNSDTGNDYGPTNEQTIWFEPTISVPDQSICEQYQFLSIQGKVYLASVEKSNSIGPVIGTFQVRNDPVESDAALVKEVTVYEIVGIDSSIEVAVLFPDQQEFYVYYFEE